jgi:hypothetical protein
MATSDCLSRATPQASPWIGRHQPAADRQRFEKASGIRWRALPLSNILAKVGAWFARVLSTLA